MYPSGPLQLGHASILALAKRLAWHAWFPDGRRISFPGLPKGIGTMCGLPALDRQVRIAFGVAGTASIL